LIKSPLLCSPEDKARIEAANSVEQLKYIEWRCGFRDRNSFRITTADVRQLHRIAITGLYSCAGEFRNALHVLVLPGGPPLRPAREVPSLVEEMLEWGNDRAGHDPLTRAAYMLWRTNAIHPFAGGNGRTARALMYLLLSADFESPLPGIRQMPVIIKERKSDYLRALAETDAQWLLLPPEVQRTDNRYLFPIRTLVGQAWAEQMNSALTGDPS
jgi:Fic family protein